MHQVSDRVPKFLVELGSFFIYTARRFIADGMTLSAGALTFSTLLALVPLIVIAFAILSGFATFDPARARMEALFFDIFVPEVGAEVGNYLTQQGHNRRQPAPAHALLLFLRHLAALQQARPRQRLRRDRRLQPHPCDPGRQRAVYRDASERHGGGAARARRQGRDGSPREGQAAPGTATPITCMHLAHEVTRTPGCLFGRFFTVREGGRICGRLWRRRVGNVSAPSAATPLSVATASRPLRTRRRQVSHPSASRDMSRRSRPASGVRPPRRSRHSSEQTRSSRSE